MYWLLPWLGATFISGAALAVPGGSAPNLKPSPAAKWDKTAASCRDMQLQVSKLSPLKAEQIGEALELLKSREFPDQDAARLAAIALHESLEAVFPHYRAIADLDCPRLRLTLGLEVLRAFHDQPLQNGKSLTDRRALLASSLTQILTAYKYPTRMEALSDALLLEPALHDQIWNLTESQRKELADLIANLRHEAGVSAAATNLGSDAWDKLGALLPNEPELKQIEFIRSNPEAQKLKAQILKEVEISSHYLARTRAVLTQLNAKK